MKINRVCLSDSYKYSHSTQYPTEMVSMYDYMEARSSKVYDKVVFFGLQGLLKEYFSTKIRKEEVSQAAEYAEKHGIPFDRTGWDFIVDNLSGRLPVRIKAIPEGLVVPNGNVLVSIESTHPSVPWIVGWMETLIMKVWYPTTIATKSYYVRKMLEGFAERTSDNLDVSFGYVNFGDRGSSSVESAAIGGVAHLTQFMGTDNFNSIDYAHKNYFENMAGFSITATEHSTVTSWGEDREFDFYNNYLEINKNKPIIACVMDSYDIYKAVDFITSGEIKQKIESEEYPIFVIRPDSGKPLNVINVIINIIEENSVAFTLNSKGYKVWNKYRLIWGDGVTPEEIENILEYVTSRGYSSENIAFGSGGDLMQNINRDTLGFAVKCSSIELETENGIVSRDVFKQPITDKGKVSKKGKVTTFINSFSGDYEVDTLDNINGRKEALEVVYENGDIKKQYTLEEIRTNSRK